jgi:RNA polymerase sigma-70 factor (ECF subfamily)
MRSTAQRSWIIMNSPHRSASWGQSQAAPADFEAIFEQHWESLCRMSYRLTGDWPEAEDIALEAFLQLYRRPPADDHNRIGWLYRVASNLGFNLLRSRQRREKYEAQAGMLEIQETHSGDPALDVERRSEQQRVREVLLTLKPRLARLLLLRYSGLSYAEIASALEIAPSSVGTLLARAEKAFEQAYDK